MTQNTPKILLGIVTKDRPELLEKSIDSAIKQSLPPTDIIIYDDASKKSYEAIKKKWPKLLWHRSEQSKGYLFYRDQILRNKNYDFIASLDDDSWFLENDSMEEGINHLEADPGIGAIAFDIIAPDKPPSINKKAKQTHTFTGCGHIIRQSAAAAVDYYEIPPGFYGAEEKDLCLKLMNKQFKIILLEGVNVWHEKSSSGRNLNLQRIGNIANELYFLVVRAPIFFALLLIPYKILRISFYSLRKKYFKHALKGFKLFFKNFRTALNSRSPVTSKSFLTFSKMSKSSK